MTSPDPFAEFKASLAGGGQGGGTSTANRPAGRYYGVPDDYVAAGQPRSLPRRPGPQGATGPALPRYTTASDDDRRLLLALPAEQIAMVQAALRQVGLISNAGYRKGIVDEATRRGFAELLGFANQRGTSWEQALTEYMSAPQAGGPEAEGRQTAQFQTQLNTFQRTDPARIRVTAEAAFAEALGRKPKPDELARFVKKFQDSEYNRQRTVFSAQDEVMRGNLDRQQAAFDADFAAQGGALPQADDADVDTFMAALSGQESNNNPNARNARTGAQGLFQIMPSNWAPWAKEAGLPANAPRTPENQKRVARAKLEQYKAQFGTWDAVAVAWYAGPGAVKGFLENPNAARYQRRQGRGNEPSIAEYVAQVKERLGGAVGASRAVPQDVRGMTGEQELNARLAALMADAPGKVSVGSGKRTRAQQAALYAKYKAGKGNKAAPPGKSKHESGEANDLVYQDAKTRQWVLDNAHRYGLVFPVGGENWHIEVARGQKAQFGPKRGVRLGSQPMPGNAPNPVSAAPAGGGLMGGQPLSTNVSVTNEDLGAQATEYARNVNPVETAAYDIGGQFNSFVQILQRGVV